MSDSKISALPAAATLTGAELVPLAQSGSTVAATVSNILSFGTGAVTGIVPNNTSAPVAAANTAAINSALALGGNVTIVVPGVYTLAASRTVTRASLNTYALCLSIPSNTSFTLGRGVTLQVAAGLTNPVAIQNSNAPSGGSNVNISVNGPGTIDGNYPNCTRVDSTDFCCILFWMQNVTNFVSTDLTINNPTAWSTGWGGCTKVRINNIQFFQSSPQINQDGLHFEGPNTDIVVNDVYGNTGDDLVAFVAVAPALYNATLAGNGPMSNIYVSGIMSAAATGCWHHVRIQDSTTYPISGVKLVNVTGPYRDGGIMLTPDGLGDATLLDKISIVDLDVYPLAGSSPASARVNCNHNVTSLQITNWNCQYTDGSETTKRPCLAAIIGTLSNLQITNWKVRDTTAAGANVPFISIPAGSAQIGDCSITNFGCVVAVSTGSNSLLTTAGSGGLGRLNLTNVDTVRLANYVISGGTGGVAGGVRIHNANSVNAQAPLIKTTVSAVFPSLKLSNCDFSGTNGGASGVISFTGLSGTCLIQAHNCVFANGANANIVRSASESIRVQSTDLPVPNTILTPARGDMILDSVNSNDPYRWSGAAWVAL